MLSVKAILHMMGISVIVAIVCVFIVSLLPNCGPVSVQIKQEVWQCEARSESSSGDVTFTGCKRDGQTQDSQDATQPDSGPELQLDPSRKMSALLN